MSDASPIKANHQRNSKGRYGALFLGALFLSAVICLICPPTPALAFDEASQKAYVQDLEDQVKKQLAYYFQKMGKSLPEELQIEINLTTDHLSPLEPKITTLNIDLGPDVPTALLTDLRFFLSGWLKKSARNMLAGQNLAQSAEPRVVLNITTNQRSWFEREYRAKLTIVALLLLPFFGFFLIVGLGWQWKYRRRSYDKNLRRPSEKMNNSGPSITTATQQTQKSLESAKSMESLPKPPTPSTVMQPADMQTMFHNMSFKQALEFLRPLEPEERLRMMDRLGLREPVKQLVLEELQV